jgi:hypothetical protein
LTEGGPKQTFEWQEGSMFSPPLNTWRQHFNVQRDEPARFVALTDAPVMINRFRNLDFIFNNSFGFRDRFSGEEGYFSGKGRVVEGHRTWDSNFIADVPEFKLIDHSARGQGASGILLYSANTISAHRRYPVGTVRGAGMGRATSSFFREKDTRCFGSPASRARASTGGRAQCSCRRQNGFTNISILEKSLPDISL